MRLMLRLFLLSICISSYGQPEALRFPDAVKSHLPKYNLLCDLEYERGNVGKAEQMFDSLVNNHLVGSLFEKYAFKKTSGGKYRLAKAKKPVLIITYASWYLMS